MGIPLVSICIPTYNGEKYLQEALDSVKAQTYKNIEVIISDDKSNDKTLEICERFKNEVDFPVYLYNHIPNGIGANWNHCIGKANGEYIQFLFQDDILDVNCLDEKLKYILQYNLKVICCKRNIIDSSGFAITSGEWFELYGDLQKNFLNLEIKTFHILKKDNLKQLEYENITKNIFGEPIAFLFKKDIVKKIGFFSTESKQVLDIEFGYKILKKYNIGFVEKPLFSFRFHKQQTTFLNYETETNLYPEFESLKKYIFKTFFFYLKSSNRKRLIKEYYPNIYGCLFRLKYLV